MALLERNTEKDKDKKDFIKIEKTEFNQKAEKNPFLAMTDVKVMEKEMYRNLYTKNFLVDYYAKLTGSRKIAELILMYADNYDLPYSTVFSLVWTESRFKTDSVNYNKSSVDRGLFQLNSKSFPELTEEDFFNIEKNIMYGTKYLKWCLDNGENYIVALAMYNAGRTKVEKNKTPRMTLDYISQILNKQQEIEAGLKKYVNFCIENSKIAFVN